MGRLVYSQLTRIYLDTNLYIYLFENHPDYASAVEKIVLACKKYKIQILASNLIFAELLVAPLQQNDSVNTKLYKNLHRELPNFNAIPVTKQIGVKAAELRAKYNLKTPDAIHLATAICQETDAFITHDQKLKPVTEANILII